MKPRKHAELMHYYADGGEIDFEAADGHWITVENPSFHKDCNYRKRPEKKRYRVAKMRNSHGYEYPLVDRSWSPAFLQEEIGFVEWITEWIDFE